LLDDARSDSDSLIQEFEPLAVRAGHVDHDVENGTSKCSAYRPEPGRKPQTKTA
jgi:hypothetical protein